MTSDLAELFELVGEVCEILGRLTGPLQRLAQELETNPTIATPKKAKRWIAADTTAFNEARDKYGDDPEKIHAALPKKQLQDIQNKLDKLLKSETKKRKQSEKTDDSSDDRATKKVAKSDSDTESQQVTSTKAKEHEKAKEHDVVSPSKNTDKSKITKTKPISKDISKMFSIKQEQQASPLAPSPDLAEESDSVSSDEFG